MRTLLWIIVIVHFLDATGRLYRLATAEYPTLNPKWNDSVSAFINGSICAWAIFFLV